MNDAILRCALPVEGALVAVFIGGCGDVVLRVEISEATHHVDELFLRHLVMLAADVGVPEVAFVISRGDGRPTRIDRLLWRELRERLAGSSTALVDVMVVGADAWWSGASGRANALRHDETHAALAGQDVEDDPVRGDRSEVRLVRDKEPLSEELHAGCGVPDHR